jgi:hypothetical protein
MTVACDKLAFKTRGEARLWLARRRSVRGTDARRVYLCGCGKYHTTSSTRSGKQSTSEKESD